MEFAIHYWSHQCQQLQHRRLWVITNVSNHILQTSIYAASSQASFKSLTHGFQEISFNWDSGTMILRIQSLLIMAVYNKVKILSDICLLFKINSYIYFNIIFQ